MGYRISVIGGGSLYTLPLLHTLCTPRADFPVSEVVLYDIDPARQRPRAEAARVVLRELNPDCRLTEAPNLEAAVRGMDYILIQIRTGGLEMRRQDERIPLLHGCVGQETCGAGGLMYGMRSVADTLAIVKAARTYAPDAWIINFSNPASVLAEATRRYFPNDDKLVYLCDMTLLMLDAFEEALHLPKGELRPDYFGLNHFGWFTHLYDRSGRDRMPEVLSALKAGGVVPEELSHDPDWVATFERLGRMARDMDGYIPNTYLEYYFYPDEIVRRSDPEHTRAVAVKNGKEKKVEAMCRTIIQSGTAKGCGLETQAHGQYILDFLLATVHPNENRQFLVPVTNGGAIPNLPDEATVEIPCVVTAQGVKRLFFGPIEPFYKGLIETQYASERLVVEGVLEKNLDKCVKGFALNRTIGSVGTAKALLLDMLEQNQTWLPELYAQARRQL